VQWLLLLAVATLALQVFFAARIALMLALDPQSTAFARSEAWRINTQPGGRAGSPKTAPRWRQQWVPYVQISDHLKRAVIAAEDDAFAYHDGLDWEALEKAWEKNNKAELAQKAAEQAAQQKAQQQTVRAANGSLKNTPVKAPKVVGGSTITQQLAKNLFLSGERTLARKGQEFLLTLMLEQFLSKERILEVYLNSVEWGEGVFGAEAASQSYFRKPALRLTAPEAARLAVMLPRPKYFEKRPQSGYLSSRAAIITARMGAAELP
jgi:monofunctional glycosyltransferase